MVKSHKLRVNYSTGIFDIRDSKDGTYVRLDPDTKTYRELDVKDLPGASLKDQTPFRLHSSGEREIIAGVECEHYINNDTYNSDICIAKNFVTNHNIGIFFSSLYIPYEIEKGAFPLKASYKFNLDNTTMLVTSVEHKKIDDSVFAIPAGYKKVEMHKTP